MVKIKFEKYSLFGNDFVIIDEIQQKGLTEQQKSLFASISFDDIFGMSADNLLIIQKNTHDTLNQINIYRNYWTTIDHSHIQKADYIFRMFEPDGSEALCCGNGLLSIAHYLEDEYNVEYSSILTEIPSGKPVIRKLISKITDDYSSLNIGKPRSLPNALFNCSNVTIYSQLQAFRGHKLRANILTQILGYNLEEIELNGYFIFTGEPHLVIFIHDNNLSLFENLIGDKYNLTDNVGGLSKFELSNQVFNLIGSELNNMFTTFPKGINLNIANVIDKSNIEYRTFERGINRETYACGTGAVAVAYIAYNLGLVSGEEIFLYPKKPRLVTHNSNMKLIVLSNQPDGDWILKGLSKRIFTGYTSIDF